MGFYTGSDYKPLSDNKLGGGTTPPDVEPPASIQDTSLRMASGLPLTMENATPVTSQMTAARKLRLLLKRYAFDFPIALLALLSLSPLLLVIGLAVCILDGRPIFFSHVREGFRRRPFRLWKFRTMRNVDPDFAEATRQEPSAFGRFLRTTSLDELPQLWNVLIGDMSIVGPRPMVPSQTVAGVPYRQVVPFYDVRHSMRPGLTGWAQANGLRGAIADEAAAVARIEHDCAYIQNFSLLLDLKTMVLTIRREFLTGTGS